MAKTVRVLSLDGGGIRGIIPAVLLARIEELAGKPISTLFDLIAGTSTGGILALGLTRPSDPGRPAYTAEQLIELYEAKGPTIFRRSPWRRGFLDERYPSAGIESVLAEYFGSSRLSEALCDVLVTSYEIERRLPFLFRSWRARMRPDYDFPMAVVARATSAAPTYFEPVRVPIEGKDDYYALIDGGVYANNPAMCAYVEARDLHPDATDFVIVSVGTGELTRPISYDEAKGWGLINWAQPLLGVVFDGVADTVNYEVERLCDRADDVGHFFRFQAVLSHANDNMDDASHTNTRALRLLAEDLTRERRADIEQLCQVLVA